ncbi:MAG: rod shape-determining protein MreC [bacterium]|nr:rod shape-determining protein MreC [bacterium]
MKMSKVLIVFVLVLVVLAFGFYQNEVKNLAYGFSSGWQQTLWQTGEKVSDLLRGFLKRGEVKEELDQAFLKNQELLSQIADLEEMEKENQRLMEALGLGLEKEFQLELASLVSKDISKDSLLINKGGKEGVFEGMPVITSGKVLVGRIGQVFEDFSEVILISNKESSFEAKIAGQDIFGVAKGKGSLKLSLELISREKTVSEGDLVVSSSLGGIFPQGLLVGEVKEIKKSDVEPFQMAEIILGFTIDNLDYLFIITGP